VLASRLRLTSEEACEVEVVTPAENLRHDESRLGSVRLVRGRGGARAPESDHAAREDEDQEEQEPDQIEREPEVGDDAAEAERLHEEERAGRDGDPAEPARQNARCEYEQVERPGGPRYPARPDWVSR
jgi:hypothetical protein